MHHHMPSIHGPFDLFPRFLNDLSAQLLPRLSLIPEFRCWFPPACNTIDQRWSPLETKMSQATVLWHSLSQGAPLLILLDLLGSKTVGSSLIYEKERVNAHDRNAAFVLEFIRRVEILEIQGILSRGEAFKVDEFLNGSCSGFIKVLKTVQRVLEALEATYPNLYELPNSIDLRKEDLFESFMDQEILHLEDLRDIKDCVEAIESLLGRRPIVLDYVAGHADRMILYQEHIVNYLQTVVTRSTNSIHWNLLFGLKENMYILGSGAYRSYCSQFFAISDFIDAVCHKNERDETLHAKCLELLQLLAVPVDHICSFIDICSAALEITHPVEHPSVFQALCSSYQTLLNLKADIFEVMQSKRTAYANRYISKHTPHARLNTECLPLGEFVLDDCLRAELRDLSKHGPSHRSSQPSHEPGKPSILPAGGETGSCVYAFLFEQMLLLGRPLTEREPADFPSHNLRHCYPGGQWNLGPAIRSGCPFDVLCAISLAEIEHVERPNAEDLAISIAWSSRKDGPNTTLLLMFYDRKQLGQWIRVLSRLAPSDSVLVDISECEECTADNPDTPNSLSWLDELEFDRRRMGSKPKPWSLIARKEGALASSLYLFSLANGSEHTIFSAKSSPRSHMHQFEQPPALSASPRSISSFRSQRSAGLVADPSKLAEAIQSIEGVLQDGEPSDLTSQVRRIGNYPAAHGGFSDVWKCNWISGRQCYKVAVKVLRGKLLNAEREDKVAKRLQHEIKIWKRLDHENVVPLYGTCSDFGRYPSLVCPWYENGSLYHYVRKNDDVLQLPERLKLLSEIAAGLAYLHSCSIVHGDLSSANILINDNGQACLCDFGLSTLVEDLVDSWYPSSMLGGAIRWSAPELYCVSCFDHAEPTRPRVSVSSDIYSYGSIALEILSGKVPYYYLKHDGQVLIELSKKVKPQRTSSPFLTNDLWDLIGECWNDNPSARPSTVCVSSQIRLLHQKTLARHSV